MAEILEREELLQIPERYLASMPEPLSRLANKMASKGIYVCRSSDALGYGENIRAKGSVRFQEETRNEWRIDYGTGWCSNETCWDDYTDIGDQIVFFFRAKGLQYDWERGNSITVEIEE